MFAQEGLGVAVGDEADVVGIRFGCYRETMGGGLRADLWLFRITYGEHAAAELFFGQHPQHIGLVLVGVVPTSQVAVAAILRLHEPRVVPGRHGIKAEGNAAFQQCAKLDFFVASQAGVGGFADCVGFNEIINDV